MEIVISINREMHRTIFRKFSRNTVHWKVSSCSILLPAHTWKQSSAMLPSDIDELPHNDEASLLMLNDHCLLKIIEQCGMCTQVNLWKVCQRTRNLLKDFVLPKGRSYEIDFGYRVPEKRLKRVREEVQCVGPHVKKLRLSNGVYIHPECAVNFVPYLQQCKKYVGASLREVEFDRMSFDIFLGRNLEMIQPLLRQTESLSITLDDGADYGKLIDVDLSNLEELTLRATSSISTVVSR